MTSFVPRESAVGDMPGLAASNASSETPLRLAILLKVSPATTVYVKIVGVGSRMRVNMGIMLGVCVGVASLDGTAVAGFGVAVIFCPQAARIQRSAKEARHIRMGKPEFLREAEELEMGAFGIMEMESPPENPARPSRPGWYRRKQ